MDNKNKNNLIEVAKEKPVRSKPPLIDKWVLLFGILAFVTIVAIILPFIVKGLGDRSSKDLKIDIRNKNNPGIGSFRVVECDNCGKLVIKDKNDDPVFEESLENTKENRLREYLIGLAKEGDTQNQNRTIKLFYNKFPNRLVDISFDISNSVIYRDRDSLKNKDDIKYSDRVFQKFKEYTSGNDSILPSDLINVRYYGPEFKKNPCNNKLVIKYIEPEWNASIVYSKHNKQLLIELGDKLPPKTEKTSLEIITNDLNEIYNTIQGFYTSGISNPNLGCHFGTYLIPHLIQISDDIVNKGYSNYEFVLVTDGEFALRNGEAYTTPKNYEVLISYLNNKIDKELIINGSPVCKHPGDRFIIVGMEYDNNFAYRQTVQQFYQELLKSCQVVFENF